jgi:hypothetical protein
MGLKVITPIPITDSILTSSTVPEPDTGEALWLVGTTYALGAVVYKNHKLYESVVAGNVGNDPEDDIQNDPANPPPYWLDLKQNTNQWAMFDNKRSTQTIGTSPMTVVLEPVQNLTSIGLFNVDAQTVRIKGETAGLFCTRATDGTYYDSDGILQTAPPNTARYSYDPANLSAEPVLLDEDAATNIILRSDDLTASPWSATASFIGSSVVNGITLYEFEDISSSLNQNNAQAITLTASTQYIVTFKVKKGTAAITRVNLQGPALAGSVGVLITWASSSFDSLNANSIVDHQLLSDGMYEVSIKILGTAVLGGSASLFLWPSNFDGSGVTVGSAKFGCFDVVAGANKTSHIFTTTTAVTRDADIINPSQGVQFDQTFDTATRNPVDFLEWFTSPFKFKKSVVVFDIPPFIDMTFTITFTATSGTVKCGAVVIGSFTDIGDILYGAKNTAQNFSRIENQLDGSLLLTKRRSVPEMTLKLSSPHAILDSLLELRDDQLNAEPTAWIGLSDQDSDLYQAFEMLGVYRQFEIDVDNPARLLIDLKVMEIM